ncbi:MAG: prepilin-type N-terminal cleavage/methylation domain-containing protein [Nitrospiraceae bacterium]|nr:MAG: prepilin-type N-terminal cleavage/methylation domain-containing protein [Nitrospiraceae bacterium]
MKRICNKSQKSEVKSRKLKDGFTLLEVVISITILSLITLIIGSAFRLGIQAWEKGEKETGETQRLRVLSSLLSQQVASAFPYKMKVDDDEPVVLFKGEEDSLLFVTTVTDSFYGGFKWVKYSYKDGSMLYKEGLLPDKKLKEKIKGDDETIDSDIEEVKFTYLSKSGEWEDSWDDEKKLPAAVRVKISYFQPFVINIPMGMDKKEDDAGLEIS